MKKVVVVSPHFPPSNLAGSHRARLFARHLPKFGWEPKVLSVDPKYYEETLDPELEALVPENLEVIRTKAIPTKPLRVVGDVGIRAFWWHYFALRKMIANEKVDLLYITIPSNYSSMLGPLIHRKYSIPYAIDYQDPWVHPWPGTDELLTKAWFSYNLSRFLEPHALRHVSLITGVAPGYYQGVLDRYPWIRGGICVSMPLGAEENDFTYLEKNPRPPQLFDPGDGNFHFVYAGTMWPKAASTVEAFMMAVLYLRDTNPTVAQKLRFHFIGTGSVRNGQSIHNIKPLADKFGLTENVIEHPARIPYLDALNHLKHSGAVLILGSDESHYTPSKVFLAVLSKRPALALLHAKSTAVEILENSNAGIAVTFDERAPVGQCVERIAHSILRTVDGDYSSSRVDWDQFSPYSAEAVTEKLAKAFDGILSNGVSEQYV